MVVFFEMVVFSYSACVGSVYFRILNFTTWINCWKLIWLLNNWVTQVGRVKFFAVSLVEVIEAIVFGFAAGLIGTITLYQGVVGYWSDLIYVCHVVLNFLKVIPLLIMYEVAIFNWTGLDGIILYLEPIALNNVLGCLCTWRSIGWSRGRRNNVRLSWRCIHSLIWK